MKITQNQEQIAKELCLKLIEKDLFMRPSVDNSCDTYNNAVGKQVGIMYQAILSQVCNQTSLND
ncbi:hypothetical protein PBV87_09140 [Niameybacter massiliensis]|uniref:Uncharacterized protein n=1 Tax=Holtiella tumoricola TaxID=3018743 RepID=A0AA42DMG7_9FIRM|nr:hypothetical protein [Holtiella tumoricola]MDA3731639.1 hypothetical protein [Holtiella tumoricola]